MKRFIFAIPLDLHRRLKVAAAQAGTSMAALVITAVEQYLAGYQTK